MKNVENFNFKVTTGNPVVDSRRPSNLRPLTLEKLDGFIEMKVKDKKLAEEVKKLARNYPQQALWSFRKNLQVHIGRAQKKLTETPLKEGELDGKNSEKESKNLDSIGDIGNGEFD